jgi:hypothetical protein
MTGNGSAGAAAIAGARRASSWRAGRERLGALARKLRCARCPAGAATAYLAFVLGAELRMVREKPIGFSRLTAVKIGMN